MGWSQSKVVPVSECCDNIFGLHQHFCQELQNIRHLKVQYSRGGTYFKNASVGIYYVLRRPNVEVLKTLERLVSTSQCNDDVARRGLGWRKVTPGNLVCRELHSRGREAAERSSVRATPNDPNIGDLNDITKPAKPCCYHVARMLLSSFELGAC